MLSAGQRCLQELIWAIDAVLVKQYKLRYDVFVRTAHYRELARCYAAISQRAFPNDGTVRTDAGRLVLWPVCHEGLNKHGKIPASVILSRVGYVMSSANLAGLDVISSVTWEDVTCYPRCHSECHFRELSPENREANH